MYQLDLTTKRQRKAKDYKEKVKEMNQFELIRRRHGLTQEEMAKCLQVTQGTVSKVENNQLVPGFDYLLGLRAAFKFNVNTLLDSGSYSVWVRY